MSAVDSILIDGADVASVRAFVRALEDFPPLSESASLYDVYSSGEGSFVVSPNGYEDDHGLALSDAAAAIRIKPAGSPLAGKLFAALEAASPWGLVLLADDTSRVVKQRKARAAA